MDILSNFGETLSELIFDHNLTPEEFSKAVNIDLSVIYRYRRKSCLPSLKNTIIIADYFQCSADFLFGLTANNNKTISKGETNFSQIFRELLESKNLTRYAFCKESNFAEQSVDDWYHGKRLPNIQNLILIAKHFDCTVDFLLGRES
ncbi:MAG: helix-turn-helix domain-containing protein [Clostridia bacterium]|nr:helix-turn-helix domain-containing protein [Clostridia bacterium]